MPLLMFIKKQLNDWYLVPGIPLEKVRDNPIYVWNSN